MLVDKEVMQAIGKEFLSDKFSDDTLEEAVNLALVNHKILVNIVSTVQESQDEISQMFTFKVVAQLLNEMADKWHDEAYREAWNQFE